MLLNVERNRELRWRGTRLNPRLFKVEHVFQIEEIDKEHIRIIQKETFRTSGQTSFIAHSKELKELILETVKLLDKVKGSENSGSS